jgi:O-antigen ligase
VLTIVHPMDWWDPILHAPLVNPVAIAAIFFSLPAFLADWRATLTRQPAIQALLLFLFAVSLSLLPTWWLGGMLATFQQFGKLAILYLLIVLNARNQRSLRTILWTFIGCSIWLAIHGILQFQTGTGFGPAKAIWYDTGKATGDGAYRITAYGLMNDPNDLCLMFIASIPLVWAEFHSTGNPVWKGAGWGLIGLFAYAATLTNSRGGYLGIIGTAGTFLLLSTRGVKRVLWLSIGLGVLMVLAPARIGSIGRGDASRAGNWGEGLSAFKSHPVFGIGYGNYADYNTQRQVAHNTYIHVLGETGLVGYLPFMALLYFTLAHLWQQIRAATIAGYQRDFALGIFASVLGYMISCYFLSRHYAPSLYILFGLALAATLIPARREKTVSEIVPSQKNEWRSAIIFALSSVAILWISVRLANRISAFG